MCDLICFLTKEVKGEIHLHARAHIHTHPFFSQTSMMLKISSVAVNFFVFLNLLLKCKYSWSCFLVLNIWGAEKQCFDWFPAVTAS